MNEREKLIELLKGVSCCYVPCDGDCGPCKNVELFDGDLEYIADHLIANGVTVAKDTNVPSKWIPASDPPKNKGEHLLVCYSDGWICDQCTPLDDGVTHWMPLPEPPKEEA